MLPTPHPKVFVAYHRPFVIDEVRASIDSLAEIMHGSAAQVRAELKRYIPEYASPADANVASENPLTLATENEAGQVSAPDKQFCPGNDATADLQAIS